MTRITTILSMDTPILDILNRAHSHGLNSHNNHSREQTWIIIRNIITKVEVVDIPIIIIILISNHLIITYRIHTINNNKCSIHSITINIPMDTTMSTPIHQVTVAPLGEEALITARQVPMLHQMTPAAIL